MSALLPFIVAGVASGALYGLAATGLVLTYKTSGVFNFGHGALAAASAYCFHELHDVRGVAWPVSVIVTVGVFAPALGLLIEPVARRLATSSEPAAGIIATVGLLLAIRGIITLLYGSASIGVRPFLPQSTFAIGVVYVGYDQLITCLVAAVLVGALFLFFRRSTLGLEMRALVDDSDLVDLVGARPVVVRRTAWVVGTAFTGVSGVLLAPRIGLDPALLTLLVVAAFGSAAVGRFTNLGVTFVAGIGIGIATELVRKLVPDHPQLIGLPPSLPFIVLFGVLVLSPAGAFAVRAARKRPHPVRRLDRRVVAGVSLAGGVLVVLLPSLVGSARLPVYTNAAIYVTIFASLSLLVRLSGQVSLCQLSFVAIGATSFSHLTAGAGLPWGIGLLLGALVAVPVGALLSLPAIRLSGLFLALATFGFAVLVEQVVYNLAVMFGAFGSRSGARPAALGLDGDRGFFYLCAAVGLLATVLAVVVTRSRLGRLLRGMADSATTLATSGADVRITRVIVFCLSAFLAAFAGGLLVGLTGQVSTTSVTAFESLTLIVVLAVSGRSLVVAPILAAVLFKVLPSYVTDPDLGSYLQIGFGLTAIGATTSSGSSAAWFARRARATEWRRRRSPVRERSMAPTPVVVDGLR